MMQKVAFQFAMLFFPLLSFSQTPGLSINPAISLSTTYSPSEDQTSRIFQLGGNGNFVQIRGRGQTDLVNLKDRKIFTLRDELGNTLSNSVNVKNRIYHVAEKGFGCTLYGLEFYPNADTNIYNISEILKMDIASRTPAQNEFLRKSRTELFSPRQDMLKKVWITKNHGNAEEIEIKEGERNYFFNTVGKFQFDVNDVSGLTAIEATKAKLNVNSREFLYLSILKGTESDQRRIINITPILSGVPNRNNLYHGGLQTDYYQGWSWDLAGVRCLSNNSFVVFVKLSTHYEKDDPRFNMPIPFTRTQHVAILYDGKLNYVKSQKVVFGDDVIVLPNEEFITIFKDGFRVFKYNSNLDLVYDSTIAESDQNGVSETAYDVMVDGEYLYACGQSKIKLNYGKKDPIIWKIGLKDGKIKEFKLLKEPSLIGAFGVYKGTIYFVTKNFLRSFRFEDSRTVQSDVASPIDLNGTHYKTIKAGYGQEWMAEDLRTTYFANGDKIKEALEFTSEDIAEPLIIKKQRPIRQGYNWYAAVDMRNVCPIGWHVPSDEEWSMLLDYLGNGYKSFFNVDASELLSVGNTQGVVGWWSTTSIDDKLGRDISLDSYGTGKGKLPKKSGQRIRCVSGDLTKKSTTSELTQFDVELLNLMRNDEAQGSQPIYPGGEAALTKYLSDNLVYPEMSRSAGVSGIVMVAYQVSPTGRVENVRVSKGVDFFLDEEAIRVVSSITGYRPGTNGHGQPIKVELSTPVKFFL